MLSALIMAYGTLKSNGVLRWRFLVLLFHELQKMVCRDCFLFLSIFLLVRLSRRCSSGLRIHRLNLSSGPATVHL